MIVNKVDEIMDDAGTAYTLAEELLELLPALGRIMFSHANMIKDGKTTFMQVRVLSFLIENRLTVSDLAKKRRVSLQSASTLVQGLVERGWVTRIPDPNDRRRSLLEVTPEGKAHARLAKEQSSRHLATSLDGLEPEEIAAGEVFLAALRRILREYMIATDASKDSESDEPE
jgi:DNA-binding MarR family transcriptional regulator